MNVLADQFVSELEPKLPSQVAALLAAQGSFAARRSRTVRLSMDVAEQINEVVESEVRQIVSQVVPEDLHENSPIVPGPGVPGGHGIV